MSLFRIVLIIAAGVAVYWLYKKRGERSQEPAINLEWQVLFRAELPDLKRLVPAGYYVNLLALSRSRIGQEECVARLDELAGKMKNADIDSQPVETLILKLEQDFEVH
jgi:hypothetical protein